MIGIEQMMGQEQIRLALPRKLGHFIDFVLACAICLHSSKSDLPPDAIAVNVVGDISARFLAQIWLVGEYHPALFQRVICFLSGEAQANVVKASGLLGALAAQLNDQAGLLRIFHLYRSGMMGCAAGYQISKFPQ